MTTLAYFRVGPGTVALITGASRGLGLALARLLADRGASLALTARGAEALERAAAALHARTDVLALAGDVADPTHAERLVDAALDRFGHVDVLVNNASSVGPSPMPALEDYPLDALERVFRVNAIAPLRLIQRVLPGMRARGGVILNVTSDAAVNAYPGWGGYGAAKAALEHLSRTLAAEVGTGDGGDGGKVAGVRVYVVDPGDMDTQMHREAEPGVDLSHLPGPDAVAPALLHLVERGTAPFGRYQAQALLAEAMVATQTAAAGSPTPSHGDHA
jgi:NAD(P)-dependent dehydrogenase (short-subunit alcohol dehydrogenase family)